GIPYRYFAGTSMAVPQVAGVVALMLQANPNLTPADIKRILAETANRGV
ncbi:MAG: S8 family serine peptidase, partial [Microcoleus sp. T3-bin5]|nr:S8 family serine peptidase [Microcoleus sp. T3-bin5]